jgi:phage terminase small subunit
MTVRKPHQLKIIEGTDRKDRMPDALIDYEAIDELPPAPDWLPNVHAVKEWDRLGPILLRAKLLTFAGMQAFGHMCALHGKIVQLYAAGESPNAAYVAQLRSLLNDFGLTPVAQGKVRPLGEEKPKNRFGNNGKRSDSPA